MINIISSEFYKIFRNKVFYFISLLYLALSIFSFLITIIIEKSDSFSADTKAGALITGIQGYTSSYSGDIMFYIIIIFVSCFITAEYSHNSIRKMTCHGIERWKLVLGQYIALSTVMTLILLCFGVLNLFLNTFLFKLGEADKTAFLQMNIGLLCMIWGVSGLSMFISQLIRHTGITIAVSFAFIVFMNFITSILALITGKNVLLSYSFQQMRITIINLESASHDVMTCSAIFLCIGIISVLGSVFLFQKRDIE